MNLYQYCRSAPQMGLDPYGLYDPDDPRFGGSPPSLPPNTRDPVDVGKDWLSGTGPDTEIFTDSDTFTKILKEHYHIKMVKALAAALAAIQCAYCIDTDYKDDWNYSLAGVAGVEKYAVDTLGLAVGEGNLAAAFLGSYSLKYTIKDIKCCKGTATLDFEVRNVTSVASGTRPPIIGYTDWWNSGPGKWMNDQFASGPMSKKTQIILWSEPLTFTSNPNCEDK